MNLPRYVIQLLADANRARALTVYLLAINDEWDQLFQLEIRSSDYDLVINKEDDLERDYRCTELLKKCIDLPYKTSKQRKAEALAAAEEVESTNRLTNRKLQRYYDVIVRGDWFLGSNWDKDLERVLRYARAWCRKMLGVIPDTLNYTWSSGSTLFDKRNLLPMDKMSKKPSVTSRAYNVLEPIWSNTRWARGLCAESPYRSHPTIVLGNLWTTVPKTARVDRSIAMEPSMNVAYQLGVGKIIRSRLKHWGLDLVSLQPHHQKLVSLASVRRHLATIDLSSASDLICSKLVEILLPEDWHDLLYSLRSEFTCYALSSNDRNEDGWQNGDWRLNEKFSSMGNGYTFELETLIFYSLSLAVQEIDGWVPDSVYTSVYGDDIIIPDAYAPYFIKTLTKLGMKPNPKKTFYGGFPFRESCGSDFYFGTNVRPFYVETFEPENPQTRVVTANSIALAGIRSCGSNWFDLRDHYLKRAWNRAVELIPSSVRSCRGPTVLGDIVLWDSRWRRYARQLECGAWRVKALKPYFDDKYYISYDRDEWTRASIIDAAVSGYLQGAGDSVNNVNGKWIYRKGKLLDSRPKVEGYKIFSLNFCEDTSMIQKFIDNSLGIRCDKEIDRLRNKRFGSNAELNFGLTVE